MQTVTRFVGEPPHQWLLFEEALRAQIPKRPSRRKLLSGPGNSAVDDKNLDRVWCIEKGSSTTTCSLEFEMIRCANRFEKWTEGSSQLSYRNVILHSLPIGNRI